MQTAIDTTHVAGLYLSTHLSDITLFVGATKRDAWKFPVHQLVLCAASPVFTAMFTGNYDESQKKEVLIRDISPCVLHKLLMFLYRGTLVVSSLSEAVDVLRASDKYEINKLKMACFNEILKYNMSLDDFWILASNHIDFGDNLTSRKMKINIFRFLDNNASAIVNHGKFVLLDQTTLLKIVSRNTFHINEVDLSDALVHWSKIRCCAEQREMSACNQRKVLGDALYEIRFLTIPIEILQNLSIFELLTNEEKELMTQLPTALNPPWKCALMKTKREANWKLHSNINLNFWDTEYTTAYFVFARDAFLNSMIIGLEGREDRLTNVTISAMDKNGSAIPVENSFKQDEITQTVNISSVYIKAFCCYKLVLEPKNVRTIVFDEEFDLWGYDHNRKAVFFSICENDVLDVEKFHSSDYWRTVFGRSPPAHDADVLFEVVNSSCILNASAMFC